MKVILQKVAKVKLSANGEVVSEIGYGLMVLVGITHDDTEVDVDNLLPKVLNTKMWHEGGTSRPTANLAGKWSKSVKDLGWEIMLISQFTLYN